MYNNEKLMVIKENFFKKLLNKIKKLFKKEKNIEKIKTQETNDTTKHKEETDNKKKNFLDSIKVEDNSEILYLKIQLENGEVRAIDLTDEQIDKLQKIYDKEIEEKKNKINRLKNVA